MNLLFNLHPAQAGFEFHVSSFKQAVDTRVDLLETWKPET
jgi:hypothetical protein